MTIPPSHCHELVIILVEGAAAALHLAVRKTLYRIYPNPKTQ